MLHELFNFHRGANNKYLIMMCYHTLFDPHMFLFQSIISTFNFGFVASFICRVWSGFTLWKKLKYGQNLMQK